MGGRYGNGQLVLLPDQDLLLVLSEEGELALVGASTDQFKDFARAPAIQGKDWNHRVLVGDVLLVRNGQEMAAFRVSLAGRLRADDFAHLTRLSWNLHLSTVPSCIDPLRYFINGDDVITRAFTL